jgi:carboxyl-terminal processing protease
MMKRSVMVCVVVLAVSMAAPLIAGEGHSCKASTQDCLNYMKSHMADRGWVGIKYDPETRKVMRVIEGSPAENAGFEKGDVMVAINGVELSDANQDKLKKMSTEKMKPGNDITYTVERAGIRKNLGVTLGKLSKEVMAQWVGNHMLEAHAEEIQIASNE